jgi:O-antigen ligase
MIDALTGLFGFALMTAWWPGVSGAATTPRWDLGVLLAVAMYFAPRVDLTTVHKIGIGLIGWLFFSLIWSEGRLDGIDAAFKILIAGCAFVVGSQLRSDRALMIGAAIGIVVNVVIAAAQAHGWRGIEVMEASGGFGALFYNGERLAGAAALVAVWVATSGRVWVRALLPLLLVALILGGSRGAWIALAAGLIVSVKHFRWTLGMTAAIGALTVLLWRDTGALNAANYERIAIWNDSLMALDFFGHGLGSFRESFPAHADLFDIAARGTRPEHPHNELLWIAYEGGLPALVALLGFALAVWSGASGRLRSVLAAFGALALFGSPLHDPATLILGALCAGFAVRDPALDGGIAHAGRGALREGVAAGSAGFRAF